MSLLRGESQFPIALRDPHLMSALAGFTSQTFWGFITSLCKSQGPGCLLQGTNPLVFWDKCLSAEIHPYCVSLYQGGVFARPCLCLFSPLQYDPFILCCIEHFIQFSVFRSFSVIHVWLQIWCVCGRRVSLGSPCIVSFLSCILTFLNIVII